MLVQSGNRGAILLSRLSKQVAKRKVACGIFCKSKPDETLGVIKSRRVLTRRKLRTSSDFEVNGADDPHGRKLGRAVVCSSE